MPGNFDELTQEGESVIIFNQGKPVVQFIPLNPYGHQFPQQELMGSVSIIGDVVSPTLPFGEWCSEAAFPS